MGTFAANVLGSFALGVLLYEAHLADVLSAETRLVVGTGFLSSFTTFSTFAFETMRLYETGGARPAARNAAANLAGSLAAVAVGSRLAAIAL